MADNGATTEIEKKPLDLEAASTGDQELDETVASTAKFINGGPDDTKIVIPTSGSDTSFSGLGKEELKKYAEDPFWVRLRWILFILFWVGWLAMLVSAIVIIVLAPRCPTRPDLKWYHSDVAYNVYAKSFLDKDKTQDGYGDLEGIVARSDYVKGLGANNLWLSGILKTDNGNDRAVLDHKMLDERFGSIDSLKTFCKQLMKEGRRVIMDLVPNQTSRNHTWFTQSQTNEIKYGTYYIWSKTNIGWKREDGTDMWVFDPVRGLFYLSQFDNLPDLNLTNENVINEFKDIVNFWASVGVSGFHINDLEYLMENSSFPAGNNNQKETHNFADNVDVVASFRKIIDDLDNKPGREKLLFGSVWHATHEQVKTYYGGEGKAGLHIVSVVLDDLKTVSSLNTLESYVNISETNWLGWKLTSSRPGSERVFSRVGNDLLLLSQVLQALLPGSSMPYYGDEIAMENGVELNKKTITPMQWSRDANAGFTKGTPWLAVNSGFDTKNKESLTAQLANNLLMNSFKELNALRKHESLQFGKTKLCPEENLFIFARIAPGFESFVVVLNMGEITAYKFIENACIGSQSSAQIVYHSHDPHEGTGLQLDQAVQIEKYEALVLKFPA